MRVPKIPNYSNKNFAAFTAYDICIQWETLTRRLCAFSEVTYCSAELTADLAHDRQLLLSQKHVIVMSQII